jgi:hypothetical protein
MRKVSLALIFIVALALGAVAETSDFYPVRVDVVKVYAHTDGFRVLYRVGTAGVADVYLPARWFVSGGKAELVRGEDSSFPYMTVFYKGGKFDHLRLYVLPNQSDSTWGMLSPDEGRGKFDSDDLKLAF